jgi:hypothetical protein
MIWYHDIRMFPGHIPLSAVDVCFRGWFWVHLQVLPKGGEGERKRTTYIVQPIKQR